MDRTINYAKLAGKVERLYKCPVCRDTGIEMISSSEAAELFPEYGKKVASVYGRADYEAQPVGIKCRRCNARDDMYIEKRKSTAEIPTSFYNSRITDFKFDIYRKNNKPVEIPAIEKIVSSFISRFSEWEKKGKGLYIYSRTKGSGKTYLASCICNTLMERYRIGTRFVSAQNLLDLSKNSDGSGNSITDPIGLLKNCKLLVIDDLGAKRTGSDWFNDVLFDIIDSRYQSKALTIITSNIMPNELDIDERITDRINAMCINIALPEYCVREKKSDDENQEFLKEMGI